MTRRSHLHFSLTILLTFGGMACGQDSPAPSAAPQATATPRLEVEKLRAKVVAKYPHDPTAFTQGLLIHEGKLYESAGLYGKSSLRRVNLESGAVEQSVEMEPTIFAEGLALVGDRLIQLTWREKKALVYDRVSFAQTGEFAYEGEGWGLTFGDGKFFMSDGSHVLYIRDAESFEQIGAFPVTQDGVPVRALNELEWANDCLYANIWQQNRIVRIDPATGRVMASIAVDQLLTAEERKKADVLNGIAFDSATGKFYITGKLWPRLYQVEFEPDSP